MTTTVAKPARTPVRDWHIQYRCDCCGDAFWTVERLVGRWTLATVLDHLPTENGCLRCGIDGFVRPVAGFRAKRDAGKR